MIKKISNYFDLKTLADLSAEDVDLTTLAPHPYTPNFIDPHPSKTSYNNINVKVM